MVDCISKNYKIMLTKMVTEDRDKAIILAVLQDFMPNCEDVVQEIPTAVAETVKRHMAEPWGIKPIYVDEDNKEEEFTSLSALIKDLGLPMSGIQCNIDGTKCKATSSVDILRIHGYTVSGNGEPRKASQGGTKLTVYHPDAIAEKPGKKKKLSGKDMVK
jgi:hypothetical protein